MCGWADFVPVFSDALMCSASSVSQQCFTCAICIMWCQFSFHIIYIYSWIDWYSARSGKSYVRKSLRFVSISFEILFIALCFFKLYDTSTYCWSSKHFVICHLFPTIRSMERPCRHICTCTFISHANTSNSNVILWWYHHPCLTW